MQISAVIFDLDGTILENEDEYGRAFNQVLKSLGVDSKTEYPQTKGIGVKENWEQFIKKYGNKTEKTLAQLAKETQDIYISGISSVTVRPGFDEFVENLKDGGIKIALATSNNWETTGKVLDKVGLQNFFDEMTTIEEVAFGKPDPSLFTVTADKLGLERNECLVVEDSPAGIEAAHRAGMKVVAIASEEGGLSSISKADLVIEGFSEISPQAIDQL